MQTGFSHANFTKEYIETNVLLFTLAQKLINGNVFFQDLGFNTRVDFIMGLNLEDGSACKIQIYPLIEKMGN